MSLKQGASLTETVTTPTYTLKMKTLDTTYSYMMLPIVIRRLREKKYHHETARDLVNQARKELKGQLFKLTERNTQFLHRRRSRTDHISLETCFEAEQRVILFALEAVNGVERYLDTNNPFFLSEALADLGTSESQYEKLLRLLAHLHPVLHEELQRAA